AVNWIPERSMITVTGVTTRSERIARTLPPGIQSGCFGLNIYFLPHSKRTRSRVRARRPSPSVQRAFIDRRVLHGPRAIPEASGDAFLTSGVDERGTVDGRHPGDVVG